MAYTCTNLNIKCKVYFKQNSHLSIYQPFLYHIFITIVPLKGMLPQTAQLSSQQAESKQVTSPFNLATKCGSHT